MNFLETRKYRKWQKHLIYEARHAINMRQDVEPPENIDAVVNACTALREAWGKRNADLLDQRGKELIAVAEKLYPIRKFPKAAENLEILIVAVGIAMAFRTFFIQPFKIPTGSMQPTLYGVTMHAPSKIKAFDTFPLKFANMAVTGSIPRSMRAPFDGKVYAVTDSNRPSDQVADAAYIPSGQQPRENHFLLGVKGRGSRSKKYDCSFNSSKFVLIGNNRRQEAVFFIPPEFEIDVKLGVSIKAGDTLAHGIERFGDHIFVDKIRYNFMKPRRGDIIVFDTDYVEGIMANTFYIKRLVGMPGETIQLHGRLEDPQSERYVMADGEKVTKPYGFERMVSDPRYAGHVQVARAAASFPHPALSVLSPELKLADNEFLPMGDNTLSSLDGRYFGGVDVQALVGPAFMVYWPISSRWGRIR